MRRNRKALVLAVVAALVVALGVGLSAQPAWQAVGGGSQPAAFKLELDGTEVPAISYELAGKPDGAKRDYTLHVDVALTEPSLIDALQPNRSFGTATITLFDAQLHRLSTLTLAEPRVVSYGQSGDSASQEFGQEVVLASKSLVVTVE